MNNIDKVKLLEKTLDKASIIKIQDSGDVNFK